MAPAEWLVVAAVGSAVAAIASLAVSFLHLWVSHAQQHMCAVVTDTEPAGDRAAFLVAVVNQGPGIAYDVGVTPMRYRDYDPDGEYESPGILSRDHAVRRGAIHMEVLTPQARTRTAVAFQGPGKLPERVAFHVSWKERRLFGLRGTRSYTLPADVPGEVQVSMPYSTS